MTNRSIFVDKKNLMPDIFDEPLEIDGLIMDTVKKDPDDEDEEPEEPGDDEDE
jgi:hypothetical protein